jgi:hypothetical protein
MAANGEVRGRVSEIQTAVAERSLVTLESHVGELARLRGVAEHEGQIAAAIKAEELRGKVCGLYVERTEHTGPGGGPIQSVSLTPGEFARIAAEVAGKV